MYVDRTAFESSYYIAEYAKENKMIPDEMLWNDKNKQVWYSHPAISESATYLYMKKQLLGNLALRNYIEPGYNILGSAYTLWYYMDKLYGIIPHDGVRRKLYFQNGTKFLLIEMLQDGFKKDTEIRISKDLSSISFSVENRTQKQHECIISLAGLEIGNYKYQINGQAIGRFEIANEVTHSVFKFTVEKENSQIQIIKL